MTIKEIIKKIEKSVRSGKIKDEYDSLLNDCLESGLSSYLLNLIIQKDKNSIGAEKETFIDDNFIVEVKKPLTSGGGGDGDDGSNSGNDNKTIIALFFLIASCILEGFFLLSLNQKNQDMKNRINESTVLLENENRM